MFLGMVPNLLQVFGGHKILCQRKPGADHKRADQIERRKYQEGEAPLPVRGDDAGDKAPEKSADHGSRHIRRHGAAHAASGPFLVHVGEHDGNDAGHEKALGETPEDERSEAGGSCRQGGRNGQQEQRRYDDFLAPAALGNHADDGCGESGGKNRRAHGETDF
jgi:hypothetical protein